MITARYSKYILCGLLLFGVIGSSHGMYPKVSETPVEEAYKMFQDCNKGSSVLNVLLFIFVFGTGCFVNEAYGWYRELRKKQGPFSIKHDKNLSRYVKDEPRKLSQQRTLFKKTVGELNGGGAVLLKMAEGRSKNNDALLKQFMDNPDRLSENEKQVLRQWLSPELINTFEQKMKKKKELEKDIKNKQRRWKEEKESGEETDGKPLVV